MIGDHPLLTSQKLTPPSVLPAKPTPKRPLCILTADPRIRPRPRVKGSGPSLDWTSSFRARLLPRWRSEGGFRRAQLSRRSAIPATTAWDPRVPLLITEVKRRQSRRHSRASRKIAATTPASSHQSQLFYRRPGPCFEALAETSVGEIFVVTLQAISGPRSPASQRWISKQRRPLISGEEEKLEVERKSILGKCGWRSVS